MPVGRYAYLNTRVSMFASRLLSREALLRWTRRGVHAQAGEARSALSDKEWGAVVTDWIGDPKAPFAALEQAALSAQLRDALIIFRPLAGTARDFVEYGMRWFELSNLKTIIRGKFAAVPGEDIRARLVDVGSFATLPADELLRTEDIAELLRSLEATPYGDIARHARRVYEESRDIFAVDAAIDRRYLLGLQKKSQGVETEERDALRRLILAITDQFNLLWLLRYRFAYGLSPAETYYLLAPSVYGLTAERLRALVGLGSLPEVVGRLPTVMRRWLLDADTVASVERGLENRIVRISEEALRDPGHPLARALAYLVLRDIQTRWILAVVKGERMGLRVDDIEIAARLGG